MLGKPPIRLNNLKTNLRFPCLGLNPIIDTISLDSSANYHFFLFPPNYKSKGEDSITEKSAFYEIRAPGTLSKDATLLFSDCIPSPWGSTLNPFALRTTKTLWSFGHSKCNRLKGKNLLLWEKILLTRSKPFFE